MSEPEVYSCKEAYIRLDDFLDRELSELEYRLVKDHLAVCEMCLKEFKFEDDVLISVREKIRHIAIPEDLKTRIFAALDAS